MTPDPPSSPASTAPRAPRSTSYRVRRVHRWLGLLIGIQFLLWTLGGLYFSWVDLDTVHGDDLHAPRPHLRADAPLASPSAVLAGLRRTEPVDSIATLELVHVLGTPTYRVAYFTRGPQGAVRKTRLADAATGAPRPAVGREEAVRIAKAEFAHPARVASVEYLTAESVGAHHEYREQPLPAWAVTFAHGSARPTAYVPAEVGRVIRIRNGRWRAFDFLWMLHTMDYRGRDDFNNLVLRAFSILGLLTVASGFTLFWLTSRPYLDRAHRAARSRQGAPGRDDATVP